MPHNEAPQRHQNWKMKYFSNIFGLRNKIQSLDRSSKDIPQPPISYSPADDVLSQNQPTQINKFQFLQELTSARRHTGRSFYQHLHGVYEHLQKLNAPQEVCDAGLFHSIYGTEFYEFQNNRITRDVVRGFIGDYAEELVHVFCTSRPRFNVIVENRLGLTTRQVRDLCMVEFANLWDQNNDGRYDEKIKVLDEMFKRIQNEG